MNVAFIPVRGGSTSIPLKNIKLISGKPLVYWTLKAACGCKYIDKVFIATDSKEIKETVESFMVGGQAQLFTKAAVISRSEESATSTASTEFSMLEFASNYEFDNIVLIQATSPLLVSDDLDRGFEAFDKEGIDSVLSAVRQKRFSWSVDEHGFANPTNYDVMNRPRRQDFEGYFVENGAFYITSRVDLLNSKNRISGNIKLVEMNEDTFFEIDEPSDWIIVEALMKKNNMTAESELPEIKMFLTDCDSCLTDGGMYYSENGDELKKFNTRDGMGFEMLHNRGIITGIVTSESVDLNLRRAKKLKLDILEAGAKDKVSVVKKLAKQYGVQLENIAYVGDDINDVEVIRMVGFGCCPNNAMPVVKEAVKFVTRTNGGEGVVREIVEKLIMAPKFTS